MDSLLPPVPWRVRSPVLCRHHVVVANDVVEFHAVDLISNAARCDNQTHALVYHHRKRLMMGQRLNVRLEFSEVRFGKAPNKVATATAPVVAQRHLLSGFEKGLSGSKRNQRSEVPKSEARMVSSFSRGHENQHARRYTTQSSCDNALIFRESQRVWNSASPDMQICFHH